MKFVVRVWDCRINTDTPCRVKEFATRTSAIKYLKQLPHYEGGLIYKEKA